MRPRQPWKCQHTDRPYRALGLCRACYLKQNGGNKRWYIANRKITIRRAAQWNTDHREQHLVISRRSKKRIYQKNPQKSIAESLHRYRTNINHRIACNLRARVRQAIHKGRKSAATLSLLGCSVLFLRHYLEQKFVAGMSWKNYGRRGWHIDHIKPCAQFDLQKPAQQRACFHYTNLQPLWAFENQSKGGRG